MSRVLLGVKEGRHRTRAGLYRPRVHRKGRRRRKNRPPDPPTWEAGRVETTGWVPFASAVAEAVFGALASLGGSVWVQRREASVA